MWGVVHRPLERLDVTSEGWRGERTLIQPVGRRVVKFYFGYYASENIGWSRQPSRCAAMQTARDPSVYSGVVQGARCYNVGGGRWYLREIFKLMM